MYNVCILSMASLKTVSVLDQLPNPILEYIIDNVSDNFLSGYRIPDSFLNSRCTWFVLFETQIVVVDSTKPFRVLDRFYIGDLNAEIVENDSGSFVRLSGESKNKDVYIQFDPSDSKSKLFSSVLIEQVNELEEIDGDPSDFQFVL